MVEQRGSTLQVIDRLAERSAEACGTSIKCTLGRRTLGRRGGGCSACKPPREFELDQEVGQLINKGAFKVSGVCLSFPKIISGRIGDAALPRWEWRQWLQTLGLLDATQSDDKLMSEKQILSLKPAPRLEQVGYKHSDRVQDCKHRSQ